MNHYLDLHLLPDPEFSAAQLMSALFAKLHRALVAQPALMIADEPTGSLDPRHADEVMTLLCELNQAGMALVMVTHDLALAARAKSRWRIAAGRIVHD